AQAPRGTAASSDVVRPASAEPASIADRAEATAEPLPALTPAGRVVVPDVRGLTPRAAARRLHWSGLAVLWESAATVTGTLPAPGTEVLPGDTIRLLPTVAAGVAARSAAADD